MVEERSPVSISASHDSPNASQKLPPISSQSDGWSSKWTKTMRFTRDVVVSLLSLLPSPP